MIIIPLASLNVAYSVVVFVDMRAFNVSLAVIAFEILVLILMLGAGNVLSANVAFKVLYRVDMLGAFGNRVVAAGPERKTDKQHKRKA